MDRRYVPDSPLPHDGIDRWCGGCGEKIKPARVTAGYVGSGRVVYGGYYGVPGYDGIYCERCAKKLIQSLTSNTNEEDIITEVEGGQGITPIVVIKDNGSASTVIKDE